MPEPDWDKEHVYTFGPSILSNPQRWKARTNAAYQLKHTYWYGNQSLPTKQDLKQYADKFPEEADKLRRMRATAVTSGYTTLAGLLGGLAYARKITKSPPVIAVSGFFTALTGFYVGDDIASWVYGTYKFDAGATDERYHKWVHDNRSEPLS